MDWFEIISENYMVEGGKALFYLEAIAEQYPVRYIAGHEHIAPGRKQGPGPGFDWPRLRQQLSSAGKTQDWKFPPGLPNSV